MVAFDELIQDLQNYAPRHDSARVGIFGLVRRNGHGLDAIFRVEGE